MNEFLSDKETTGLTPLSQLEPIAGDGYAACKNYILIQLCRDGNYLSFYLVPTPGRTCRVVCLVPELEMIETAKEQRLRLLKLMNYSPLFAKVLKNSLSPQSPQNDFLFTKFRDLDTGEPRWAVTYTSELPYNKVVLIEESPENNALCDIMNDICQVINDVYTVHEQYNSDHSNRPWIARSPLATLNGTMKALLEHDVAPLYKPVETLNQHLRSDGYIIVTPDGDGYFHGMEVPVLRNRNYTMYIRAALFFPELKDSDYVFSIGLSPCGQSKWRVFVPMEAELLEIIDRLLANIHTNETKLDALAYRFLPLTSHIWVNSNPALRNRDFTKILARRDRTDTTLADIPFHDTGYKQIVRAGSVLRLKETADLELQNGRWNNLDQIALLLYYQLLVYGELLNLAHNFKTFKDIARQHARGRLLENVLTTVKLGGYGLRFARILGLL